MAQKPPLPPLLVPSAFGEGGAGSSNVSPADAQPGADGSGFTSPRTPVTGVSGSVHRPQSRLSSRRSACLVAQESPATQASRLCSPCASPRLVESRVADASCTPPDAHAVVQVRHTQRSPLPKPGERHAGLQRPTATCLRGFTLLQRRLALIIISGIFFGGAMHGLVFWHGASVSRQQQVAREPKPPVASSPFPLPRKRPLTLEDKQRLGMPGDSDRLPFQRPWNASNWSGFARPDPSQPGWPNTVAICTIMKNEHPDDVEEWLLYHRWVGVDKVYLRENAVHLPEGLQRRLLPYVQSGFVDLGVLPGPKHPFQNRWYNRCSKPDLAGNHSWVAFIDMDEFIVVLDQGRAARNPSLKRVLEGFKGNAGLSMQWVVFGSSGHQDRPSPGGPLAHYSRCTGHLSFQMKCLANMYHATHHMMVGNTVHDCTYRYNGGAVTEPPVTTSDGTQLHMYQNDDMTNPRNDPELGHSRTYSGHLDQSTYNPTITDRHQLALFHFVTRSLADYTGRKVKLPSGKYTFDYARKQKKYKMDITDFAVMAAFEHENGFDGEFGICSSAVAAGYAESCCRPMGW